MKPDRAQIKRTLQGHTLTITIRRNAAKRPHYILDFTLPNGSRQRPSTGATDLKTATQIAQTIDLEPYCTAGIPAGHGGATDPKIATLADHYTDVWLPNRNRRATTLATVRAHLREFETFCRAERIGRVSQLSPAVIERYAAELRHAGNGPNTIGHKLGTLRAMCNAAVETELLTVSPIRRWLQPDVPDPEIQPLEPHELVLALEAVRVHAPRVYNAIRWCAHTGNRPSATRALKRAQVDLDRLLVYRTDEKPGRFAIYQISEAAAAAIHDELARDIDSPVIFTGAAGRPFAKNDLLKGFKRALHRSGHLKAATTNIKTLRHTYGYIMANYAGCPLPTLQILMNHKDIQTTMRYVKNADATRYLHEFTRQCGLGILPKAPGPEKKQKKIEKSPKTP